MASQVRHHRFTVDLYEEMITKGILTSSDRVELLAGEIIEMSPIGTPHSACVDRLNRIFTTALGTRAIVRVQGAVALPPHSEPEPDLAILRDRSDFYSHAHPRPDDVLLLVEVAESSLKFDRSFKRPLYAAAGIREMWIVDVNGGAIECYTDPKGRTYETARIFRGEDALASDSFPELRLRVCDVLGAP